MSKISKPAAVSIVTIVLNEPDALARTIKSVASQTYENLEYVVVDGGSSKATLEVIRAHRRVVSTWISEPDNGIYDAMNKGAGLAVGEWVLFMNAGDIFAGDDVISRMMGGLVDADLVYGKALFDFGDKKRPFFNRSVDQIWKGVVCAHQSLFVRRKLLIDHPFSKEYKIAADFEFSVAMYAQGRRFLEKDVVVSELDPHGISRVDRIRCYRESWRIVAKSIGGFKVDCYYVYQIVAEAFKRPVRKLLKR